MLSLIVFSMPTYLIFKISSFPHKVRWLHVEKWVCLGAGGAIVAAPAPGLKPAILRPAGQGGSSGPARKCVEVSTRGCFKETKLRSSGSARSAAEPDRLSRDMLQLGRGRVLSLGRGFKGEQREAQELPLQQCDVGGVWSGGRARQLVRRVRWEGVPGPPPIRQQLLVQ
uniref:Uncharacterized protein n=1 Tax=Sphaerodactylus townsendi TaxID=933632 RepID=A0ACB8FJJ6_9SAUR